MPDEKLQALAALVFVDAQAVHDAAGWRQKFCLAEKHRIDSDAVPGQLEFQMLLPHDALAQNGECVVKQGGRETLSPYLFFELCCSAEA